MCGPLLAMLAHWQSAIMSPIRHAIASFANAAQVHPLKNRAFRLSTPIPMILLKFSRMSKAGGQGYAKAQLLHIVDPKVRCVLNMSGLEIMYVAHLAYLLSKRWLRHCLLVT